MPITRVELAQFVESRFCRSICRSRSKPDGAKRVKVVSNF
jgi:hypothetical protein